MKNEKINLIEDMLSKALTTMEEKDYLKLINHFQNLKEYDAILSKMDDEYSYDYLDSLSIEKLDSIIDYLQKETTK